MTDTFSKEAEKIMRVFFENDPYVKPAVEKLASLHNAAVASARIDELDKHIGIYNQLFEPNGEFRSFGSLKPMDVARLYTRIGERIRELEAELQTPKGSNHE